jgi:hypothetical protein
MKRTWYSKFVLIAAFSFAACIALAPCKAVTGFGGVGEPAVTQPEKAQEAIP